MTSDLSYAEEREMDARFEAHQDRLAEEREQAERLGFDVGDHVTVGKSQKVWVVDEFFDGYTPGVPLVRLEPLEGYNGTSVEVTRLKAVQS